MQGACTTGVISLSLEEGGTVKDKGGAQQKGREK